jgi:hypothetical protein
VLSAWVDNPIKNVLADLNEYPRHVNSTRK